MRHLSQSITHLSRVMQKKKKIRNRLSMHFPIIWKLSTKDKYRKEVKTENKFQDTGQNLCLSHLMTNVLYLIFFIQISHSQRISITLELIRKANSWTTPVFLSQKFWSCSHKCVSLSPPGDCNVGLRLRPSNLDHLSDYRVCITSAVLFNKAFVTLKHKEYNISGGSVLMKIATKKGGKGYCIFQVIFTLRAGVQTQLICLFHSTFL